jgi:hypothetical protein
MAENRIIFVSWTPQSRARDLAARLDAEYFVPAMWITSCWWPARYCVQAIATVAAILRRRPAIVLFTNPPFLAGVVCLLGTRLVNAQCWADCHSGAYNDPRWARFARANTAVIRRCDGTVFHNALMAAEQGDMTRRAIVLSVYAMTDRAATGDSLEATKRSRPLMVATCSYGFDEPIDIILAAAERAPQIDVAMTGVAPPELRRKAPGNVQFTGWLSDSDYHETIRKASAVICLTTREATMQNGIVEALEHRRPVITSHTRMLTEWAQDVAGILTIEHTPQALEIAMTTIAADQDRWLSHAEHGQRAALRRARGELSKLQDAIVAGSR